MRTWDLQDLPAVIVDALLAAFFEDLELLVGMDLADQLTEEQLDELEELIDSGDEDASTAFLEAQVPDYKQRVRAQASRLSANVSAALPEIRAALARVPEATRARRSGRVA